VTEPKRSQKPKRPLSLSFLPNGYNIFENALKSLYRNDRYFVERSIIQNLPSPSPPRSGGEGRGEVELGDLGAKLSTKQVKVVSEESGSVSVAIPTLSVHSRECHIDRGRKSLKPNRASWKAVCLVITNFWTNAAATSPRATRSPACATASRTSSELQQQIKPIRTSRRDEGN